MIVGWSGHFTFQGRIQPKGHGSWLIRIMLDSGATSNFISKQFVEEHKIPLERKNKPVPLSVIDGTPLSSKAVTHHTRRCDLTLGMEAEHRETLNLDIIPKANYDVVLRMPWLNVHNSWVHWTKRKLVFESGYSHWATAVVAATIEGSWVASTVEEKADDLPEAYKEYEHLFGEGEGEGEENGLPQHQPWDLSIELMENKNPPWRPIYTMTEP